MNIPENKLNEISDSDTEDPEFVKRHTLKNILVELSNEAGSRKRVTDATGEFSFTDLPPGVWTVKFYGGSLPEHYYFEKDSILLDLKPGDRKEVSVKVLPKKRSVRIIQQGKTLTAKKKSADNARSGEKKGFYYTVKIGDWLSKIAKRNYGNTMQYDKIFKANRDQIKDPNLIYPGQRLFIPE